jgi:hypothetical protein
VAPDGGCGVVGDWAKVADAEKTRMPSARIHVRFIAVLLFDRCSIYFESGHRGRLPTNTSRMVPARLEPDAAS